MKSCRTEIDKNVIFLFIVITNLKTLQRWESKPEFYILNIGSSTLLCQFIEPVTFAHYAFTFALWNITLGGYLDTRTMYIETFRTFTDVRPEI